jgi:hypothetical protein
MANVAQLIINITANAKQSLKAINSVNSNMNRMTSNIIKNMGRSRDSVKQFENSFNFGAKVAGVVIGIQTLTQLIGRTIMAGVEFNKTMDTANMNMQTLTGHNTELAKGLVQQMVVLANSSPLSTEHFLKAGVTLASVGVETEDLIVTMKMLGDVSLGNSEKFQRLAYAYAQVQAAGRLMGQENLQFTNALFSPLAVIAERLAAVYGGLGKDYMPVVKKAMEEGAISAKMVTQTFLLATSAGGRYFDAMVSGTKTFEGQMSILYEQVGMLIGGALKPLMDFMATTLLPIVNYVLQKIITFFGLMGVNLDDLKKKIESATLSTDTMSGSTAKLTKDTKKQSKAVKDNLQGFDELNNISKDMQNIESIGMPDVTPGAMPTPTSSNLSKIMDEATAGLKPNMKMLDFDLPSVKEFKEMIKNLIPEEVVTAFKNLNSEIKTLLENIGTKFTTAWQAVINIFGEPLKTAAQGLVTGGLEIITGALKTMNGILTGDFKTAWEGVKTMWDGTKTASSGVLKAMEDLLDKGVKKLKDGVQKLKEKFDNLSLPMQIIIGAVGALATAITVFLLPALIRSGALMAAQAAKDMWKWTVGIYNQIKASLILAFTTSKDLVKALISYGVEGWKALFVTDANKKSIIAQTIAWIKNKAIMVAIRVQMALTTAAQWLLNSSMYAFPGIWIALAIIGVVAALIYFWETSEGFRDAFQTVVQYIKASFWWLVDWIGYGIKFMAWWFADKLPYSIEEMKFAAIELFLGLSYKVAEIFTEIRKNILSKIKSLIDGFNKILEKVGMPTITFNVDLDDTSLMKSIKATQNTFTSMKNLELGKEKAALDESFKLLKAPTQTLEDRVKEYKKTDKKWEKIGISDSIDKVKTALGLKDANGKDKTDTKVADASKPIDNTVDTKDTKNTTDSSLMDNIGLGGLMTEITNAITIDESSLTALGNMITQAMQSVMPGMGGTQQKPTTLQASLNIDGKELAKVMAPLMEEEQSRQGTTAISTV